MSEDDYVLGTRDDEVARLGLQHRVWRPWMLDAWHRAGLRPGMAAIDVGAGPGFAATDMAEIVGPAGSVLALERSRHFVGVLKARAAAAGLANIEAREHDVCAAPFGAAAADFAWCRWLLSFVADPPRTVAHVAEALRPGGVAVFHEYLDYGAWRMIPPDPEQERFRSLVMRSWRDAGGEPDIGLHLPRSAEAAGLAVVKARPLVHLCAKGDFIWAWPAAFVAGNAPRLAELGYADADEAQRLAGTLERAAESTRMLTPIVLELIVRKP